MHLAFRLGQSIDDCGGNVEDGRLSDVDCGAKAEIVDRCIPGEGIQHIGRWYQEAAARPLLDLVVGVWSPWRPVK